MEFGIWNLRAASGLWRNAQLMGNSADLPGGNTSLLSLNEFLNSLRPAFDHGKCELLRLTTEFSNTIINEDDGRIGENTPFYVGEIKQDNNEYSIEKRMEYLENHRESLRLFESVHSMNAQSNEEHSNESDSASTESDKQTLTSDNNCMKDGLRIFDHPLSSLYGYDRIEANVPPLISGWVLSVYTALLSRLSGTVPLEVTKIPELPSDKDDDFESDNNSSCTEKSRDNDSPTNSIDNRDYPCDKCDVIYPTKSSSKDEIFQDHPISLTSIGERSDANFDRNEENVGTHVVDNHNGRPANSRRRKTMPLQRVRYRYEREEYRCSMCNYACTIEKAFQRHLKAHAKGTAEPATSLSCAVCGADRSSEVDLSRHMKRHRDDRYFCCDICIFRTVQLKKLIQHRRMHTGEKPHLCPHCAYRSARRDNLRSHVRRVHKKENLYCDTFNPRSISIPPSSPGIPLIGKSHN